MQVRILLPAPHLQRVVSAFEWTKWNDSERVDVLVRPEVMRLHVMPMASFTDALLVDHTLNKCLKVRIIDDSTKVALEVDNVHQIKPRKRGEQTDVSLGEDTFFAHQPTNPVLQGEVPVRQVVQITPSRLPRKRLSSGETCFVHAVVDRFIVGINHGINVRFQFLRAQAPAVSKSSFGKLIEHSYDFTALVVDDGCVCSIPKHRHSTNSWTLLPTRKRTVVDSLEACLTVHGVSGCAFFFRVEGP